MFLEAIAAVSLHCTAEVTRSVKGPHWNSDWRTEVLNPAFPIRVYVDYDRTYAYIEMGDSPEDNRKVETSSVLVTDAVIRVVDGFFGFHRIDELSINRSTGAFTMRLIDATSPTRDTVRYSGTCEPGEPIQLPERPAPRF